MSKIKRVYHTYDKWECYPAGFYEEQAEGLTEQECKEAYAGFLKDEHRFREALASVLISWPNSSEHYLTNEKMNRIAWLGQASACIALGVPSKYRSGYFLLSKEEQQAADLIALEYLNDWLVSRGEEPVNLEGAGVSAKANLY